MYIHVHLKKWTLKFKLLYLRNYISYFNKCCIICCANTHIQSLKVWLKSVLTWLLNYSIFSRGLFFYWRTLYVLFYLSVYRLTQKFAHENKMHCQTAVCICVYVVNIVVKSWVMMFSCFRGHFAIWNCFGCCFRVTIAKSSCLDVATCSCGNVTSAVWQVTLCDSIWHASCRSCEAVVTYDFYYLFFNVCCTRGVICCLWLSCLSIDYNSVVRCLSLC